MKRTLSLILAVLMLTSAFMINVSAVQTDVSKLSYDATSEGCISLDDAITAYEEENSVVIETYRNYFYIPDGSESFFDDEDSEVPSWYNEYFSDVCIWYNSDMCDNAPTPSSYCGYSINKTEEKNIYYANIPVGVEQFVINNGVDSDEPIYSACSSSILGPEETEVGDDLNYHDDMIYVLNIFDSASMSSTAYYYGDWYYYYGDGCYGTVENGTADNCIRDDHIQHNRSEFKYIDKIFERFGATEYYEQQAIMDVYDEVYYHYSNDNAQEPDWALVLCPLNPAPIERKYGTLVGDRILSVVGGACAVFPDGYGVYVREIDTFIPLRQSSLEQIVETCPDFIEAIEENEIGQQFGDVDNDGELSILDATYIQRFLAKLYDFIQTYYLVSLDGGNRRVSVCDFDRDGNTNIIDATAIQRRLAKLDKDPNQEPEETPGLDFPIAPTECDHY